VIGTGGAGGEVCTARKRGLWRTVVATSFIVSVFRGIVNMPDAVAYTLQFGPIIIGIISFLVGCKPSPMRRADRAILFALLGIVLVALLSSITSVAPRESFAQTGLLALLVLFLGLTFWLRWQTAEIICGDLALIFTLICVVQLAGVVGTVAGNPATIANYGGFLAAVAIPLAVYLFTATRHHALAVVGAAISLPTLIFSGSRGGILAAVAGIFALFLLSTGRRVLAPLGWAGGFVAILAIGFRPEFVERIAKFFSRDQQRTDLTSGRIRIYEEILQRWQQDPMFGTGYRTIETYSRDGHSGHNTYLSVLAETGIVGAIVLACLIVCVVIAGTTRGSDKTLAGAVVAVAVMELTESSVFGWGGPTALISWLLFLGYAALGRSFTSEINYGAVPELANHTFERNRAVGKMP
jgi:O-antigen ligase